MLRRRRSWTGSSLTSSCRIKAEALARAFNRRIWPCTWVDRRTPGMGDEYEDEEFFEASHPDDRGHEDTVKRQENRTSLYELLIHQHSVDDAIDVFYDVSDSVAQLSDCDKTGEIVLHQPNSISKCFRPFENGCEVHRNLNGASEGLDVNGASVSVKNGFVDLCHSEERTDQAKGENGMEQNGDKQGSGCICSSKKCLEECRERSGEEPSVNLKCSADCHEINNSKDQVKKTLNSIECCNEEHCENTAKQNDYLVGKDKCPSLSYGTFEKKVSQSNSTFESSPSREEKIMRISTDCFDLCLELEKEQSTKLTDTSKPLNKSCKSECSTKESQSNNDKVLVPEVQSNISSMIKSKDCSNITNSSRAISSTLVPEALNEEFYEDKCSQLSPRNMESRENIHEHKNCVADCLDNSSLIDVTVANNGTNSFCGLKGMDKTSLGEYIKLDENIEEISGNKLVLERSENSDFQINPSYKQRTNDSYLFNEIILTDHVQTQLTSVENWEQNVNDIEITGLTIANKDTVQDHRPYQLSIECYDNEDLAKSIGFGDDMIEIKTKAEDSENLQEIEPSDDNDRLQVFNEIRPMISRSTSLKTGKTPPGTPSRKKIVRFADVLGLDLEDVRHIISGDLPSIPSSAYSDLVLDEHAAPDCITIELNHRQPSSWESLQGTAGPNSLFPQFDIPGQQADFEDRVRTQGICLESLVISDCNVQCTCRVMNWSFNKKVTARYTTNGWCTSSDINASYVPDSTRDGMDTFAFNIFLTRQRNDLEFALCYRVSGKEHWDNNNGNNYRLSYHDVSSISSAVPSSPTWIHQFW